MGREVAGSSPAVAPQKIEQTEHEKRNILASRFRSCSRHHSSSIYGLVINTTPRGRETPRISHHINRKPAANLLHAVNLAERLGRPLNTLATINFALTDCPAEEVSRRFEKLRDNHFAPWLRRCGRRENLAGPPTFVWVIENAGGCVNAHWLLHIPADRAADFLRRLPTWLERVAGAINDPDRVIDIKTAHTPKGAIKYMVKGIDPIYAPLYRIRPSEQGIVHGNRSNFSRCLGPRVRKMLQAEGKMPRTRRIGLPRTVNDAMKGT